MYVYEDQLKILRWDIKIRKSIYIYSEVATLILSYICDTKFTTELHLFYSILVHSLIKASEYIDVCLSISRRKECQ